MQSKVHVGAHETTEHTSERTEGSIFTLNNRKNLTPPITIFLSSTYKDITPDSLWTFPKISTETK